MIEVEVGDTIVEFPDGTTPDIITAALRKAFPQPGPVADRFGEMQAPANAPAMQEGLEQRATQMTTGPADSPVQQMVTAYQNLLPGAKQGTSPHVEDYRKNLISTDVYMNDAGHAQFRDPQTKEMVTTDNTKHVVLRDPVDGKLKVFGRSEQTNESAPFGVAQVLAPGLASGAVTRRAMIPAASKADMVPKASDIFSTAKPDYKAFDRAASSTGVTADETKNLVDRVQNALDTAHLPVEVAEQVHRTVARIGKAEDVTLSHLQSVKQAVGKLFQSPDKNVRDGAAVASKEINRIISELSPEAGASLKRADAIHSTARSVQELQRKESIADMRTGRAGYSGNAVNSMRQSLAPILQKSIEGRTTGFKPEEISAIREIVEGTTATNAARLVGQFSPTKGIVQTAVAGGGAGYAMGPAVGLAIPAIGAASNKLAAVMTGKQVERLKELVAKRSPAYAEAVAKATERYEKAQVELINQPSPAKLAAYVSASRALSSGLTRDGIPITSGELLKAIRGPMQGAAEGEEPAVPGLPSE
jgi:hypothetical protein